MSEAVFPDAEYVVLASRLIPDMDGGFTIAALSRARMMPGAHLLTFDPGTAAAHAEHRETFVSRGMLDDASQMRNLFDEANASEGGAAEWLRAAADPALRAGDVEYRQIVDAEGRPFVSLPVIPANPDWHLTEEPVLIHGADGAVAGGLRGFRGLYRAWLQRIVDAAGDRPLVVVCEARQIGELIHDWDHPRVRIIHTVQTIHVQEPYTPDAPMNGLWTRWFSVAGDFDLVAWPTPSQRDDVETRFGELGPTEIVPNVVHPPASRLAEREPGLVVMMCRLAPGKRIDHSIRAFVAADVPGSRLEIWGGGPEQERLQQLIDELGVGDRVMLAGYTRNPGAVLDRASLVVMSTAFEGQPLSVIEALQHGTPIVSYDARYGIRDVLAEGGGLLVPNGDENALAEALRRVLTDDALRAELSASAAHAVADWMPEAAVGALQRAVARVLASPSRRI